MKKLLFFVTEDWYFSMHFLHFAVAAKKCGWSVHLVCNTGQKGSAALEKIVRAGIDVLPLQLSRTSISPFEDFRAFSKIYSFSKMWKPDLILAVALKPIFYSLILSRLINVKVLNMMTGLGYVFTSSSLKARLIQPLVKSLLKWSMVLKSNRLIVLNKDDACWAKEKLGVCPDKIELLPGVGIDVDRFKPCKKMEKDIGFAYLGRMLRDKGLFELMSAVKILRQQGINFKLFLAGEPDPSNPASIPVATIQQWVEDGLCKYLGQIADVPAFLQGADVLILPSYREGMPTCILEAASTGIPSISTDVPGCRDAVIHGVTGLLVPVQDPDALAQAIRFMVENSDSRAIMGENARKMVIETYSQELVVNKLIGLFEKTVS